MKIAITSTNGKTIDTHFGQATCFYIYDVHDRQAKFIEKRFTMGYCITKENHQFRKDRFDNVFNIIGDCLLLYTAKIGEVPLDALRERGMSVRIFEGKISEIYSLC